MTTQTTFAPISFVLQVDGRLCSGSRREKLRVERGVGGTKTKTKMRRDERDETRETKTKTKTKTKDDILSVQFLM